MNALELFAGIGGIALAEQMAGINVVGLSEVKEFPIKVLQKNFPTIPILRDVRKINKQNLRCSGIDPKTIDIISGGFPCQPFSVAGKRKGKEDDRDLWPEMFRIIKEIRPGWVVGENVANFANMELDRTLSDLESEGYETRSFVLPACAVGAPHQRYRTFIVANADGFRWQCMDKSEEGRCFRRFAQNSRTKSWKRSGYRPNDLLLAGSEEIASGNRKFRRNDDGLSSGVDRLTALGNAVVPQQILPIFDGIVTIEKEIENCSLFRKEAKYAETH